MLTTKTLRGFLFLLLTASLTGLGFAQEKNPAPSKPADTRSLDETERWIQKQLETYSGSSYQVQSGSGQEQRSWQSTNLYSNVHFLGCEMLLEQTHKKDDMQPREIQFSVPLWDLASATYTLDDGNHGGDNPFRYVPQVPSIFVRTRTKSIHWQKPKTYFPTDTLELEFGLKEDPRLPDILTGLSKAFMHAAELCAPQAPKE